MGIAVLGPLSLDDSDVVLGRRDRVVLAALALRPGQAMSSDRLLDALWGDDPPASAGKNLQGCVVRLRKLLGQEAIETSPRGYRLTLPVDDVDAQRFERMVTRARELLSLGEPERAAYLLADALALWRGQPFVELEGWDLGVVEAERLQELKLEAEEFLVDASLRAGRYADVLADAEAMVKAAPMRERRWGLLALAQYQSGRQGEALRTIHQVKSLLVENLGLDPGPELTTLEQAILRQDDSLLAGAAIPTSSATCPYQGLTSYDVDDSEGYFGRDADLADCLELLRSKGVLAVVGPSGSGKSSLVRAGVAASLMREGRRVLVVTPGSHPMHALTSVTGRGPVPVLIVDQCEEVFSLCQESTERLSFFAALAEHAEAGQLVIALRADRLSDVSAYPGFARLVERGLHLLGAMDEAGLREAIEAPARQSGLLVEQGLVDLLVREVEGEPGALPLLSHALQETWQRREGNTLTVAGYMATGGIRGAVAQSAEDVYGRLPPDQRHLVRDLLLRLVTPGAEGEPVRSKVPRRLVVVADPAQAQLIDMLVGSRLVTSDEGMVQLAHEALARAWPRLRAWLDDDIQGQRILHHVSDAADAWNSLGRPDSEVYRGVRLAQALEWQGHAHSELTATEREFLETSERLAAEEEQTAVQRAKHQARLIHRLRGVLVGAAALLVAALIAGALAVHQKGRAEDNAVNAVAAGTAAEAGRAGARALATDDVDTSMLLAVAAVRLDDSPETRSSLLAALAQHPELIASTQMAGGAIISFDVSPDGRTVVTYDSANHVRLYEIGSGKLLGEFQAGAEPQSSPMTTGHIGFSPDGRSVAAQMAAPTRQPVTLLDADNLKPLPIQPGGASQKRWQVIGVAYSGDGHHLAATMWRIQGSGSTLRPTSTWAVVWDLDAPRRPSARIRLDDGHTSFVALSPDGRVLYTTAPLTIHDLASGRSVPVGQVEPAGPLDMSPDGRLLASSGAPDVLLLDAETGALRRRLAADGAYVWTVNFSADGRRIAAVSDTLDGLVWDVATGSLRARVPLKERGDMVDLSADGSTMYSSTMYTAGPDGSLRHWDLAGNRRFIAQVALAPEGLGDYNNLQQPAADGTLISYSNPVENNVTFFDVSAGTVGPSLDRGTGYRGGAEEGTWHPDAAHYALATGGEIRVWNARTGELTKKRRPAGPYASAIDYSTDGSRLVMGELSGRATMLDSTSLTPVGRPIRLREPVRQVSAGPDNHTVIALTGVQDPAGFWVGKSTGWALVDLEAGTVLHEGDLEFNANHVAFSPDGRHVAVSGRGGQVLLLNTESGEPLRSPVFGHDDDVSSLVYSQDGKRIVTAGLDATVSLWDPETGLLLARVVPRRSSPWRGSAKTRNRC